MPAAAVRPGDRYEIDDVLGPQRDRPDTRLALLEHRCHLGLAGGPDGVHDALGLLPAHPGQRLLVDHGVHQTLTVAGGGYELRRRQDTRHHREPGERMGVEQDPAPLPRVDAGLQEPGRDPERRRTGPPERAGVGAEAGVDAGGDVGVEFDAQVVEDVEHQHGGAVGGRVHQVEIAETGVRRVVVDDDRGLRRGERLTERVQPLEVGGVDRDHQWVSDDLRGSAQQLATGQPGERRRELFGPRVGDLDVDAPAVECQPQRQTAADRVRIGADMTADGHRGRGGQRRGDRRTRRSAHSRVPVVSSSADR